MILGVLLRRRAHLKTLASVIDAGHARGHDVRIIYDPVAAKKGDSLNRDEVTRIWPATPISRPRGTRESRPPEVDVLVGVDAALAPFSGLPMIGVDNFFDRWLQPLRSDVTYAWTSLTHVTTHRTLWSGEIHHPSIVGWLQADQVSLASVDAAMDGIREPRDSAVFFTLKMAVPEPWRHSREGRASYRDIFEQAKRKAKDEGLRFIVKSRAKHRDPWWVRWRWAEYHLDECMVPYTSLSLLARAEWCVHFESGAVWEAALMGAYSYAIPVPQSHIINLPGGRLQYGGDALMHDWPAVSQYGMEGPGRVPQRIIRRPRVDQEARRAYLDHFLGPCDGKAGERVVQMAEGR